MQNFFVYDSQVQGENIYIEGTDVNHIVHVLPYEGWRGSQCTR